MSWNKKIPKAKKGAWFVKVRGSYLPASTAGWLTYVPFVAYLLWPLVYAANRSLSLSEAVFLVVPQWAAAAVVMTWLAARKS